MAPLFTALILTALLSALAALGLGANLLVEHGDVSHALSVALMICGVSSITAGLLAGAVSRGR